MNFVDECCENMRSKARFLANNNEKTQKKTESNSKQYGKQSMDDKWDHGSGFGWRR